MSKFEKYEQERGVDAPDNKLDAEIKEIKESYEGVDRARLVREIIVDLKDADSPLYTDKEIKPKKGKLSEADGASCYILPGMHGKDTQHIRENYEERDYDNIHWSGESVHVYQVGQGKMIDIPRDTKSDPYAFADMSHCSLLVGYSPEKLSIAHISYSLEEQALVVLDKFQKDNIQREDIYAVANTSPQENDAYDGTQLSISERLKGSSDYEEHGIPSDNIAAFRYRRTEENNEYYDRNCQLAVAGEDILFTSGYDKPVGEHTAEYNFNPEADQLLK